MSLNYLGISHFPVLHHQLSPTSPKFPLESASSQSLTDDSKEVLIERLNDLVIRLANSSLDDGVVTAIHGDVNRIERHLRGRERLSQSQSQSPVSTTSKLERAFDAPTNATRSEKENFWAPPTPTRSISMYLPRMESFQSSPEPRTLLNETHTHQVEEITKSAATLVSQLTTAVTELQARREESQVYYNVLWTLTRFQLYRTTVNLMAAYKWTTYCPGTKRC